MSSTKARPYQEELLEASLEENTIVNLGTGAGKTFIAVMLIKELSADVILHGKKSVFLVTTVPLVKQQAEYICRHTRLDVGSYMGSMNVDSWSSQKWQEELAAHQVLVMTMTIFKNLILQRHMTFSDVNLLIFDECHHAVKNHDYVQIMRRYTDAPARLEGSMRILGLTASLIPSKCKPGMLEGKILDLERTLCCRAQTARNLEMVARYATNPKEVQHVYDSGETDPDVVSLKHILCEPLDFLASVKKDKQKGEFYEMIKVNLDDCLHVLLNLGIWCANQFAVRALEDLNDQIKECNSIFASRWDKTLLHLACTHLRMFVKDSEGVLKRPGRQEHTVDKVKQLFQILAANSGASNRNPLQGGACGSNGIPESSNKLVGIIFTERRTTASFLSSLLNKQSQCKPDMSHIKCGYVIGHDARSRLTHLRREAKMNTKKQDEVLEKFRGGKLNLVVSTSVLEEGVDVPKCNLVIRFDFPQNFRSYIQSKGRARAKESRYVLFIPREDYGRLIQDVRNYNGMAKDLEKVCRNRHVEDDYRHLTDQVPPYENGFGATATINSSLSLVHGYCQKRLPHDRYTVVSPIFTPEKREVNHFTLNRYRLPDQKFEFQSTLTFPMSCPVKESVKGLWFPTKRLADKSAALEAVKKLDEAGELDRHLKPVSRPDDSEGEEEEEEGEGEGEEQGGSSNHTRPISEGKSTYYPNKVSPALTGCFPRCDHDNHLYIFYISDASGGGLYLSRPLEQEQQLSFGILSSKPLPHWQIPDYSIYVSDKELHVKICKNDSPVSLNERDLALLKDAHHALFSSVLKISPPWLECMFGEAEKDYLVVPLYFVPFLPYTLAYVDFDSARLLASMKSAGPREGPVLADAHLIPMHWPGDRERLRNAIVVRTYDTSPLYEVQEVSSVKTVSSPCDMAGYATFKDYFVKKYQCVFTDDAQPALTCKPLGESSARMQLLRSRYKTNSGADVKKSENRHRRVIELFPEVCRFYPLPADLWKLAFCVPSILWRLECILTVEQLRTRVSSETGIGLLPDGSELTTCIDFRGYKDIGFGSLASQRLVTDDDKRGQLRILVKDSSHDPLTPPLRGPDNALLLQALTSKSASDSIDLERLETLGDSFLKLAATVFLFYDRTDAYEGRLSSARSRRVSNKNLHRLAGQRGIPDTIFSAIFDPKAMWLPPCCVFDGNHPDLAATRVGNGVSAQEKAYLYHKLTLKGVADCVESLTGAYLVAGGIPAGLKFLSWMGVKIQPPEGEKDHGTVAAAAAVMECVGNGESLSGVAEAMEVTRLCDAEFEEGEIASSSNSITGPMTSSAGSITSLTGSTESYAEAPKPKQRKLSHDDWRPPIFVQNSSGIFKSFFGEPPPPRELDERQRTDLNRLLSKSLGSSGGREILGWHFGDRTLLLQAITHASYSKNRLTDCYQRLEFLGDAVLDYLVTCHIYSNFPDYGPGEITDMRSALVNNNTFAEFSVGLELHKVLMYNSPSLYKQIEKYIKCNSERRTEEEVATALQESLSEEHLLGEGVSNRLGEDSDEEEDKQEEEEGEEEEDYEEEIEDWDPPKVLGDLVESLAGAIFIDSGRSLEAVWSVFKPHFDRKIESFGGKVPPAPVHELYRRHQNTTVKYKSEGPRRAKCTMTVPQGPGIRNPVRCTAVASTRKAAKNAAAKGLLAKLDVLHAK